MITVIDSIIQTQLFERRTKLEHALVDLGDNKELKRLLQEVDTALERIKNGDFGLCEVCRSEIEPDRLMANPLTKFCLGDLTVSQQQELQRDLEMASLIQKSLLPKENINLTGWNVSYKYQPLGLVSGDYCDLININNGNNGNSGNNGEFYFVLGDVSGKGVAASMLMTQLHAMFRSFISLDLPLVQIVERVSSIFCESTMPMHFATLVCGKVSKDSEVEICNAGHLPPLLIQENKLIDIQATGLPVGMFCNEVFSSTKFNLLPNDTLLLFTDGLTEAENRFGDEYGKDRLTNLLFEHCLDSLDTLINFIIKDLNHFQSGNNLADDLTLMALRRIC
ncbi:MAG: SpoIIE family protein phosphatase [Acidobacteria bacterium]|nr:SpoIIE family protein phosphatase [Acidobacteriota bacterium]